jgi:hypothetical protein
VAASGEFVPKTIACMNEANLEKYCQKTYLLEARILHDNIASLTHNHDILFRIYNSYLSNGG